MSSTTFRKLTLNEKITAKGILASRGVAGANLVRLGTRDLLWFWQRVVGFSPIRLITGR